MIRGVKLMSIPVKDQDVALKFYTEKLGFKVATDQEMAPGQQRWIELMIPGSETRLALFTPPGFESRIGGFQGMTFWTDDVSATAEEMKSKGVRLSAEPRKESWGTMAIFKDPDGNEFVFRGDKRVVRNGSRFRSMAHSCARLHEWGTRGMRMYGPPALLVDQIIFV